MVDKSISKLEDLVKEKPEKVLIRKIENESYDTLYGLVKRGQIIAGKPGIKNLKNDFVYSVFKANKDKKMYPEEKWPYKNNKICLNEQECSTTKLFDKLFPSKIYVKDKKIFPYHKIKKMSETTLNKKIQRDELKRLTIDELIKKTRRSIVEDVFGEGLVSIFSRVHTAHLQTKEKRTGTNYYFVHPVRIAYDIKDECEKLNRDSEYCKTIITIALLHDVVESLQTWRRKRKTRLADKIRGEKSSNKIGYQILKINRQLDNPPELQEGGLINLFSKKPDYGEKIMRMIGAISNIKKENYETYISDLFKEVQAYFNKESINMKEFYDIVPIVKLYDAIDNTETLKEADADAQLKRLNRNTILAENTYKFMYKNKISKQDNQLLWQGLETLLNKSETIGETLKKKYENLSTQRKKETSVVQKADASGYKKVANDFSNIQTRLEQIYSDIQTFKKTGE